ncbi:hypothetical protein GCM10028806_33880 [Spirosoma terrae]|uniref:Uncharacterized protein n=1 Tax=Spirosoma terrae TaxID=1968276 RepID=A0A6L9LGC6_9BACT|nr:hypothetical protein [Spirosoma terrae]NDU95699.1 hypothetical protein [Spirosoma terrae]
MAQQPTTIHRTSTWNKEDQFTISGSQLQTIMDLAAVFRPVVYLADSLLLSGQKSGIIKDTLVDENGNTIDPSQLDAQLRDLAGLFNPNG